MGEITVDQILEEKDGSIALVLRQPEPWEAAGVLTTFQTKINGYVSIICDGPLLEKYPEYRGKKFKVRLICHYDITDAVRAKLDRVNLHLNQLGIGFVVMRIEVADPSKRRDTIKESIVSLYKRLRGSKG